MEDEESQNNNCHPRHINNNKVSKHNAVLLPISTRPYPCLRCLKSGFHIKDQVDSTDLIISTAL